MNVNFVIAFVAFVRRSHAIELLEVTLLIDNILYASAAVQIVALLSFLVSFGGLMKEQIKSW